MHTPQQLSKLFHYFISSYQKTFTIFKLKYFKIGVGYIYWIFSNYCQAPLVWGWRGAGLPNIYKSSLYYPKNMKIKSGMGQFGTVFIVFYNNYKMWNWYWMKLIKYFQWYFNVRSAIKIRLYHTPDVRLRSLHILRLFTTNCFPKIRFHDQYHSLFTHSKVLNFCKKFVAISKLRRVLVTVVALS